MGREQSRTSNKDLTPRERRARLQSFSPKDAAFVLHLMECERCRQRAGKLLAPEEAAPGLSPAERDLILDLVRGGYLLSSSGEAPRADLPLAELRKFLRALSPEETGFVGHLLGCERCRRAVAKALKPPAAVPPRNPVLMI